VGPFELLEADFFAHVDEPFDVGPIELVLSWLRFVDDEQLAGALDGVTDGADFLVWQRQFKVATPGTPASIPEPTSMLLLAVIVACALPRRYRGQRR